MKMPPANPAIIAQKTEIAARMTAALGADSVITAETELRAYECDAFSAYRQPPLMAVLPRSTEEVAAVMKICAEFGAPIVPRGSGTSLTGGSLPLADSVVVGLARMNQILDVDYDNRIAKVQAGATNLSVTKAVEDDGFFYAPDPSSQLACAIGGNIAMNSGGAHCLKYGVTTNNLLGVKMVMTDGEIVDIGGGALDASGLDLLGVICGAEGQLGLVTEATLRILRQAEGARPMLLAFSRNEDAGACVADIIKSGQLPVAIEFMDKEAIRCCEEFSGAGYPIEAQALLIVEVEGSESEIDDQLTQIEEVARRHAPIALRRSQGPDQSAAIWAGRKAAFAAMGSLGDYICLDGVAPLGAIPQLLRDTERLSAEYGLQVANVFHAGDGNLHPLIVYDAQKPGDLEKAELLGAELLKLCVRHGGCLSGEHGVGVEKRDLMSVQFTPAELAQQKAVKTVFDPMWLLNPGKVFPLDDDTTDEAAA